MPDDLCTEYETDLEKLEWKYIQTNADVVHGIQLNQIKYENEVDELESQFRTKNSEYTWWVDSLDDDQDDRHVDQLMRKIVFDIKDQYKLKNNEFTTPRGLTMLMVNWLDTIAEERKNVQKYFGKLQKFTENIKPISKLSEDVRAHVEQLIHSAFICHLDFENVSTRLSPTRLPPNIHVNKLNWFFSECQSTNAKQAKTQSGMSLMQSEGRLGDLRMRHIRQENCAAQRRGSGHMETGISGTSAETYASNMIFSIEIRMKY